jgi:beta-galactosidase
MTVSVKNIALPLSALVLILVNKAVAQAAFMPPASPHEDYSFDMGWKFFKEDGAKMGNGEAPSLDDKAWEAVTTPHSFNDVDSCRKFMVHYGGDQGVWKGTVWYRKHFQLPAGAAGKQVIIEFEGMRQAADIYLNGKQVGLYENGVTPYGLDISSAVNYSGDNVLALHLDNTITYKEKSSGVAFEWNVNDFNPDYGGINRHVQLHLTSPIYQTYPLYYGTQTTGIYVYPGNFNIAGKSADIHVESEVKNTSGTRATVTLSASVVDAAGVARATFEGKSVDVDAGGKVVVSAMGNLKEAHFWSPDEPYLYDVYTTLTVGGKVVDVRKTTTGFRKAEFKGGAGTGGVYINDKFVYLKGYSQRSANDWAGVGAGYPQWMHDLTAKLVREDHGNYMRWMHVAPQATDSDAFDRWGIVQVVPAADREADAKDRQWDQRAEVMEDTLIYFRNSPSNLFWETGNTGVTAAHMAQMVALRKKWDPNGGRVMGCRSLRDPGAVEATEYFGVMLGGPYNNQARDKAPIIETEDYREEGARRFWDDVSPPYFGFKKGPLDTWNLNSETFALGSVRRYNNFLTNSINNTDSAKAKWSGYASIYFTDSNADGRQQSSEVTRVSGKVDGMRLPKEIYFAHRVIQSATPDLHILGHWTYPANTKKTMYVISNTKTVELLLNGQSLGKNSTPTDGFNFAFPNVAFQPGTLVAIGSNDGKEVARQELQTAGAAKSIKLTPMTAPGGMRADGEDIALLDFEVVDAQGRRCPTDDARVDFTCSGPGVWRGGINSGKEGSTNNLYLNTECGINRVAVRSTTTAGKITVTAKREGLEAASVDIQTKAVAVTNGLAKLEPVYLPVK